MVEDASGNTTAPGSFSGVPLSAVAGPYAYTINRGNLDGSQPDNWYLRSALDCDRASDFADCQPDPDPGQGPDPDPPIPHFREHVSLYSAIPPMAAIYGRHLVDTLHERVGFGAGRAAAPGLHAAGGEAVNGAWGRVIGHFGHRDGHELGIYGGGPEFDYTFGALQTGLDLYGREGADGSQDRAGLYFAFGHGEVDVKHNLLGRQIEGGDDTFDALSVGGYWTHWGATGWYLDGVVQGTFYDFTASPRRLLPIPDAQFDGTGIATSLEAGYPFDLGNGWTVEPEAQLIYQHIGFDDFSDVAADVRFDDLDSLAGRLGALVSKSWAIEEEQGNGGAVPLRQFSVWGRLDVWHEFLAETTVEFSSADGFIPFSHDLDDTWLEAGLGASLDLTQTTALYGNVNYETTFDGDAWGVDGKVGLRVRW